MIYIDLLINGIWLEALWRVGLEANGYRSVFEVYKGILLIEECIDYRLVVCCKIRVARVIYTELLSAESSSDISSLYQVELFYILL